MAYATTSDVEVELGRPASGSAETNQWQAWLDRTERSIERRFTREGLVLATQVALGKPTEQDVIDVEVARVIDKIENPSSRRTSYTRSVDDASQTARYEGGDSGDALTITDDEWAILLPVTGRRPGVFSVMPS